MTINETRPGAANLLNTLVQKLRAGMVLVAKLGIAGLLIVAAGVLAVATAIAGLVIASIAILLRFIGRRTPLHGQTRQAERSTTETGSITLDARPTAHGWTVE